MARTLYLYVSRSTAIDRPLEKEYGLAVKEEVEEDWSILSLVCRCLALCPYCLLYCAIPIVC